MAAKQALAKVSHQLFHLVREKLKFKHLQTTILKCLELLNQIVSTLRASYYLGVHACEKSLRASLPKVKGVK